MKTLRHTIETNGTSGFGSDFENVRAIAFKITENHSGTEATVNDDRMFLRVIIHGNGAALRDLVTALDQAGYLD